MIGAWANRASTKRILVSARPLVQSILEEIVPGGI